MKSLFQSDVYQEITNRIEQIQAEDQPKWGKMSVAQMMRHCQMPLELALGRITITKPNFFMRMVIKSFKKSMYNDEPWKKSAPTLRQFRVADQRD